MCSITVLEAIDEYRTYNRAQNYSPAYGTSSYRNLEEFARWLAEEGRSDRIADLGIEDARAFMVDVQERENRTRPGTRRASGIRDASPCATSSAGNTDSRQ